MQLLDATIAKTHPGLANISMNEFNNISFILLLLSTLSFFFLLNIFCKYIVSQKNTFLLASVVKIYLPVIVFIYLFSSYFHFLHTPYFLNLKPIVW